MAGYLELPKYQREAMIQRDRYQPFKVLEVSKGFNVPYSLRPGRLLVRGFLPAQNHRSGLVIARLRDQLLCMGHIIALHSDNQHGLKLHDFIMFEPYSEYEVDYTDEEQFVPYAVVSERDILAVIDPPPARLHVTA